MANTVYENFVLENKLAELLKTKIDLNSYMTIDGQLTEEPGMKKVINTYTATYGCGACLLQTIEAGGRCTCGGVHRQLVW